MAVPYTITVTGPVTVNLHQETTDMSDQDVLLQQLVVQATQIKAHADAALAAQDRMNTKLDILITFAQNAANSHVDPALQAQAAQALADIQSADMAFEALTQQDDAASTKMDQAVVPS